MRKKCVQIKHTGESFCDNRLDTCLLLEVLPKLSFSFDTLDAFRLHPPLTDWNFATILQFLRIGRIGEVTVSHYVEYAIGILFSAQVFSSPIIKRIYLIPDFGIRGETGVASVLLPCSDFGNIPFR